MTPVECTCAAIDMPFGRCCKANPELTHDELFSDERPFAFAFRNAVTPAEHEARNGVAA